MNIKVKQMFETFVVLIAIFLLVILFTTFSSHVFSSDIVISLKMFFELSPYILMALLVAGVCKFNKRPLSIGLGFKNCHIAKQLLIAVIIFAITISFIIIPLLFGTNKSDVLSFKAKSPIILIYYVIKSIIFVGIGEELVWRGYFFERISEITGSGIWALVLSSVLFGLWHYPNGHNIMQVLMVIGLGLIYGYARLKVKDCSSLATGIAHGLHDAVIIILSFFLL